MNRKLDTIPSGFKSVCTFKFSPSLPEEFNNLETLDGWQTNDNSIILCRHEDIDISSLSSTYPVYMDSYIYVVHSLLQNRSISIFSSNDLPSIIHLKSQGDKMTEDWMNMLLRYLLQAGLIQKKDNGKFEVVKS